MDEKAARVFHRVAAESPEADDQPAAAGWLQRMCRAAVSDLPAFGVGVSLLSDEGQLVRAAASSPAAVLVEELQFSHGEGPCLLSYATRGPVLVPELAVAAATMWPGYAPAAYQHGIRAVFAFPLQVGTARMGALGVYRSHPGGLSAEGVAQSLSFAAAATERLLQSTPDHEAGALMDDPLTNETRVEVYQAQGMVMVQLSVGADDALARIRAHAFVTGRTLLAVAEGIVSRAIVLERDS